MNVIQNVSYVQVAKLIKNNHIVAIFQGKDEGGPRALGNRSFLFNPMAKNMDIMLNKKKGREWYRPVAGSMLLEKFDAWFETAGLKESPFMTYAIDVKEDRKNIISAIVHKNGTCRIQTVSEENNFHYYNLIKAFYDLTGIPIIGNTSFNLAGDPIAHTLEDALNNLNESKFEYLYLPEKSTLIYAKNEV